MSMYRTIALHAGDRACRDRFAGIAKAARAGLGRGVRAGDIDQLGMATRYLDAAIADESVPEVTAPKLGHSACEWRCRGTETVAYTGTHLFRFQQEYDGIPVYGSLVCVELGQDNALVAINARIAEPVLRSIVPRVSPQKALEVAGKAAGYGARTPHARVNPYIYPDRGGRWRLVYIVDDVKVRRRGRAGRASSEELERFDQGSARVLDYVIDAMTGRFVEALPRHSTLSEEASAPDDHGKMRRFRVEVVSGGRRRLSDVALGIATHDLEYLDYSDASGNRPGPHVERPPAFSRAAVSAHHNAGQFARFLRSELGRLNWDGRGGLMRSSINAVRNGDGTLRSWRGASWTDDQVVFGQLRLSDGTWRSYAAGADVVGHEMFHGVIDATARLDNTQAEPGALNESLADIFGTFLKNWETSDIGPWDWIIGSGVAGRATSIRSLSKPSDYRDPMHMRDYRPSYAQHRNAGIHNHAAYRLITAKAGATFLFNPRECARIYYNSLLQLTANSGFSDSRRAVIAAARTLFSGMPQTEIDKRVQAIVAAYDAVGIA